MSKAQLRVVDDTFDDSEEAQIEATMDVLSTGAAKGLRDIVSRIERLNEEEEAVKTDKKEVFAEAKGQGYDVKVLRKVIARRKQDKAKRQEEEAMIDLYETALDEL